MSEFIPWSSQEHDTWAERYAEGKFLDLDGHRTHYTERGQGKPVILLHGFNLDSHTWMKNVDALAAHFKLYIPDLWGQGYSTRQPLDYGYELFVEQISLFMEALDIQKPSFIGHSMGGGTSIVLACKNPEIVDKLVLVDSTGIPSTLPFRSKIFRLRGVAELLMSLPTDKIRRKNLEDFWIYNREALTNENFLKLIRYQKIEGSTEAILTILRKDFFNTLENEIQELGSLDIPTLIIWGRADKTLPLASGEKMHQLIHGSNLEILEDAAHLANFDRANEFNELVIQFLAGG